MLKEKGGSRPPWVGLGAAVWVQIASGTTATFPLYSHALKSVLGFDQRHITLLGVANDIGENLSLLPGIACNKFPPWLLVVVGSLAAFLGYGVIFLAVSQILPSLHFLLLWLALLVAANSSAWLTTSVVVTNMRNFPASRGSVAGVLKGYGGISGAVWTEIYSILLHNNSSTFLLFLAVGVPVICFSMMFLVRPCTPATGDDPAEHYHFLFVQGSSVIMGVYLLVSTILGNVSPFSDAVSYALVTVMVLLLMAPLAVPLKMTLFPRNGSKSESPEQSVGPSESLTHGKDESAEPLLASSSAGALGSFNDEDDSSEVAELLALGEGAVKQKKRRPKRGEDFKLSEAIVKADFWLLFLVFFVGIGTGVTVLNNLAQIGIAQGEEDTTTLLSIFSFCNFLGRLGGGVVSEHFVRTRTLPRTIWMTFTQIIMLIVYLLFAYAINGTLYPAVAFLGVCFGVQVSAMVPTVSEVFGLKHFGVLSSIMSLGNPIGAFLFSVLLAGNIYDNEAAKQHVILPDSAASCLGPNCFKLTFLILAGVCGAGIILSVILTLRIKPVYRMLYAGGSFRLPQTSASH
ncbi:unnamed protein product [Sphenostylis stenocarpa]|uniref:Nodulin-like domain-containing protein n=1 Tax=Sphenostylis stenocarpa TaxID=92480 RepID=A0AA86W0V4_9FABA|nr:unnamed protein product [Sphenostylis stenocarpa]